jgi:hypothetical protein
MTGNAVIARWHATNPAGQAVMSPADVADTPPRRSLASWLLRRLGPPPLPPRCYFYKSVYSVRPTAGLVSFAARRRRPDRNLSTKVLILVSRFAVALDHHAMEGCARHETRRSSRGPGPPGYNAVDRAGPPATSGRYARLPYVRGKRRRARSPLTPRHWSSLPRPDEGRSSGAVCRGPAAQIRRCHDRRSPVRGRGLGSCLLVHARRSSPGAVRQSATPSPGHGRRLLASCTFSHTPTRQIGLGPRRAGGAHR